SAAATVMNSGALQNAETSRSVHPLKGDFMNKLKVLLLAYCLPVALLASSASTTKPAAESPTVSFSEITYQGRLSDDEARFTVDVDATATGRAQVPVPLFEGDVAVLPAKLPDTLKIVRTGNRYFLVAARPGRFRFQLELVARIQRTEPWNQISFTGPAATISSVNAQAGGSGMEVQLLNGTLLESTRTNGVSRRKGFSGRRPDRGVALEKQSGGSDAQTHAHRRFCDRGPDRAHRHQIHQPVSL